MAKDNLAVAMVSEDNIARQGNNAEHYPGKG